MRSDYEDGTKNQNDRGAAVVLAVTAISLFFCFTPMSTIIAGILAPAIALDFGWPRAQMATVVTMSFITLALSTPIIGMLIGRYSARSVVLVCACSYGCLLFFFSLIGPSYIVFVGITLVLGAVGAGTTYFALFSVFPIWFERRLGLAFGIAITGVGAGQAGLPIIVDWLNRSFGWRPTFQVLALCVFLIVVPILWFGYHSKKITGDYRVSGMIDQGEKDGLTLSAAIRQVSFWTLFAAFFTIAAICTGTILQMVLLLESKGFDPVRAAQGLSLVGVAMLLSRLAIGFLLDITSTRLIGTIVFLCAGLGTLLLAESASPPLLFAGALLVGVGLGAESDIMAYIIKKQFGRADFPRIYGIFGTSYYLGGPLLGSSMLALSYNYSETYRWALLAFACGTVVSVLLLLVTPRVQESAELGLLATRGS